MKNKNSVLLKDFSAYCKAHPEYRFWQAIRNWSGYRFIWGEIAEEQLEDTFYLESKRQ